MIFNKYSEYIDSRVEYLGDIPSSWQVGALRRLTSSIFNGLSANQIEPSFDTVPVSRIETISKGVIDMDSVGYIHIDDARIDRLHEENDILFSNINSLKMIGNCAILTNENLYAGMNLLCIRPGKCNPKWLFWLLRSYVFRQKVESLAKPAINQASISQGSLLNISCPIPSYEEQNRISIFLDIETKRIDYLISKQEKLIEFLKEKRQAIISHAVTKGLDPDFQMKDSGVDWIGLIPKHWKVVNGKYLFEILKRISGTDGYDVLSITQKGIKVKDISSGEGQLSMDYSKYQIVEIGDFAMNHMDLLTGFVDVSKFMGVTSPDYRVFKIRDFTTTAPEFFLKVLQNCYIEKLFFPYGQGSALMGRWRLPTDAFNCFKYPLPPIKEQIAISNFLANENEKISNLISKAETSIELAKEHRSALISAAVTGKIDVRDFNLEEAS